MAASNLRRGPFIELKRAGGSFRNAEANQVAADMEIRAPALARRSERMAETGSKMPGDSVAEFYVGRTADMTKGFRWGRDFTLTEIQDFKNTESSPTSLCISMI